MVHRASPTHGCLFTRFVTCDKRCFHYKLTSRAAGGHSCHRLFGLPRIDAVCGAVLDHTLTACGRSSPVPLAKGSCCLLFIGVGEPRDAQIVPIDSTIVVVFGPAAHQPRAQTVPRRCHSTGEELLPGRLWHHVNMGSKAEPCYVVLGLDFCQPQDMTALSTFSAQ